MGWLGVATPLLAQGPQAFTLPDTAAVIGLSPEAKHLRFVEASPAPVALFEGADTLPCPQCDPKKHFWVAFAEVFAVEFIPALVNRARGQEWAETDWDTWAQNLTLPWQWDNNAFKNNQFSHPYHGALYYNAARTNGYNFWQSAPFALGGSLMWELFFEAWAPAPNDLTNTTLGGITLGEMLYRVSSLTLRNESRGVDRIVREVAAGLLNPVRGFNRVVRGEAWKVSQTPPDWRPSKVFGALDVGYRGFTAGEEISDSTTLHGGIFIAELRYGDMDLDVGKAPFSAFNLQLVLATNNGGSGALTELRVRGSLGAKQLGDTPGRTQLAGFMSYDYTVNPILQFGGQGFYYGPMINRGSEKGPKLSAELLGQFMPVAAVQSSYFITEEGRDYDYGIGLGGKGEAFLAWPGTGGFGLKARYIYIPIISGFPGSHQLLTLGAGARIYYKGRIGLGADIAHLWKFSNYTGRADVDQQNSELRIYLTTSVPQWRQSQ